MCYNTKYIIFSSKKVVSQVICPDNTANRNPKRDRGDVVLPPDAMRQLMSVENLESVLGFIEFIRLVREFYPFEDVAGGNPDYRMQERTFNGLNGFDYKFQVILNPDGHIYHFRIDETRRGDNLTYASVFVDIYSEDYRRTKQLHFGGWITSSIILEIFLRTVLNQSIRPNIVGSLLR